MLPSVIAHCDWSIDARKRWMAVAVHRAGRLELSAPEPVGDTSTLIERLQARAVSGGPLLLGFDFPIGLPQAYARKTGLVSFRGFLDVVGTDGWADWFCVATAAEDITLRRPFYPARPGGTRRSQLFEALALAPADLLRLCEQPAPGRQTPAMLFWTLGGNQVGKAAITGWREVILPHRYRIGLWPFDGRLVDLLQRHAVVVTETYPGDAYGQIGIARRPVWSKRSHWGRLSVAGYLRQWLAAHERVTANAALAASIEAGFGADAAGEDRFDCTVGLMAMIDIALGLRGEGAPPNDRVTTWEGWILGRSAL
ncbi:DUF429 domain-containing protein [Affinirhizobium pseudoryzae]|uniref:DUF429 domain-containing protein n=1 Tax=Allorhizobium pseudoryzae TaxID=379684 RepID=UPI0013EDC753|nr:DUF429 domain-containing protein [Allorhizobium pseudoryzae]